MGVLGCVLCIVGSTVIILHAPEEQTPSSVAQIWHLATQPGIPPDHKYIVLHIDLVKKYTSTKNNLSVCL
jgi:hypothetical protein